MASPTILVIRKSLKVFVCGIIGFLPALGIFPAFFAILSWRENNSGLGSLLCAIVCGCAAVSVVVGLFAAIYSLVGWASIRSLLKNCWNPAERYLNVGVGLGLAGLLAAVLLIAMALLAFGPHEPDWWP
jgi:hypothetical protein